MHNTALTHIDAMMTVKAATHFQVLAWLELVQLAHTHPSNALFERIVARAF
jgi:hypothetical protein